MAVRVIALIRIAPSMMGHDEHDEKYIIANMYDE